MDTDKAINYILDLNSKGVYGMRINEGNGWFSPFENLQPIIEHIKKRTENNEPLWLFKKEKWKTNTEGGKEFC